MTSSSSDIQRPKLPDEPIQAQFSVIEKVGSGGMSRIYKARQRMLNRIVALKVCRSAATSGDAISRRFERECLLLSSLAHENIAYPIMAARDPKIDRFFYAMEFIDGPSLEELLAANGRFKEKYALELALTLAGTLEYMQGNSVAHLDIKPSNLILNQQGVLKLIDFGVARPFETERSTDFKMEGTPLYMAPEQSGLMPGLMDGRTDLYAVGCLLFHLLAGKPPYEGTSSSEVLRAHLRGDIPRVECLNPDVSLGCTDLIRQLMQREKSQRVESAAVLRVRIQALLGAIEKNETTGSAKPVLRRRILRVRR